MQPRLFPPLVLALAACAAPETNHQPPAPKPPRPAPPLVVSSVAAPATEASPVMEAGSVVAQDLVLARVGGREIGVRALLGEWLHLDSSAAFDQLDKLVNTQLALLEAQRLGLSLGPELVEARYLQARAEIGGILEKNAPGLSPEEYVSKELGLDPTRYFARVREDCAHQLIAERVVRAFLLSSERVIARLIVVREEGAVAKVREGLSAGRDFGELARLYSLDASSKQDGLIAPIVRDEFTALSRLAFGATPGELAGPIEQFGTTLWLLVEERLPAQESTWSSLGAMVEASLRSDPVEEAEYRQWRPAMERRYAIDLRPLLELAGEPLPSLPQNERRP